MKFHLYDGLFRKDLYYRLNVFPIEIPPSENGRQLHKLMKKYAIRKEESRH